MQVTMNVAFSYLRLDETLLGATLLLQFGKYVRIVVGYVIILKFQNISYRDRKSRIWNDKIDKKNDKISVIQWENAKECFALTAKLLRA